MKRATRLFDKIYQWDNLRLAVVKSLRGKRHRADALEFLVDLDRNLARIQQEIQLGSFRFGIARQFMVFDPKPRIITAPRFEERVVHHAIMNICEPHLDRSLIDDTYACRRGRGREKCVERAKQFSGRYSFFLKLDIRKYFDSISHQQLETLLARRFKEARLIDLFQQIVSGFQLTAGRGLPIGSLVSQHLANQYLASFDRYCKESLHIPGYVRYMDDMILWSNDRHGLSAILVKLKQFIDKECKLEFKPSPFINPTRSGITFLGCRVFPSHVTLNHRSRKRYRQRLIELEQLLRIETITEQQYQERATSLSAFATAAAAKTWTFRSSVLHNRVTIG